MKTIKFILFTLFIMSLTSCSFLFYGDNNQQMNIREGMTKKEVRSMLGAPDYRRFEKDFEEWEYSSARITIVRFRKDKVIGMDMFSPQVFAPLPHYSPSQEVSDN